MNTRAFTLALVIASIAMFMVYTFIDEREQNFKTKFGREVPVVIAKVDIQELELIDDSKLQEISVPSSFKHKHAFNSREELKNTIATVPILKGEQITKPRVTYPGSSTGLSRQISLGKRAMSITITEQQAVSKLIKPGDRVDVVGVIDFTSGSRKDLSFVHTVLQDVLVLSTGISMTNSIPLIGIKGANAVRTMKLNTYSQYNTVTLELEPYQVQKMIYLIEETGKKPFLILRNNNDDKKVALKGTRMFDLVGKENMAKAKSFFSEKYKKQ
ncbi:MAG: Flp pilus assembly protein CpaB [Halobacteriovoraceae bacterium]|mgnify:CR=1 FL=1|nr:Flp pilus assembly protein CpaB [Halobacteriovoraceae bacterium]|tara:strand:- start:1064 stop:1876 length:813 start_codon:yes stop_codon:yes gene_type:complete